MDTGVRNDNGKEFSVLGYVADIGRQAGATVDGAMKTKVPVLGTVGDIVQTAASRIPVAANIVGIAQEAAAAVEKATQPGLTRTQTAKSLSSSIFWIAIRRHPLYAALKIALFAAAALSIVLACLLAWWLI